MPQHFITRDQLCLRWGVSRATTYRLEKLGHLPRPVRLGPASARWPLHEIERIEERAAADRGEAKP